MPASSIVLVEDNPDDHRLLREAFFDIAPDIELRHAANLSSAWSLIAEVSEHALPALVITDHHLPDGLGQDLITRLRDCPSRCHLPVVMVSGDVSPPTDLGGITWFGKPDTWAGWCALAHALAGRMSKP